MQHPTFLARGAIVFALLLATGCGRREIDGPAAPPPAPDAATGGGSVLVDVAAETGLVFEHRNGGTGELYFVEPVGVGGALVDLDDDGDLDVVLVQGRLLAPSGSERADPLDRADPGFADAAHGARVFRNDLVMNEAGVATLRFTDVTAESGLRADGYGMGVASGDYDDDGRIDLYFTCFGHNQLWRNLSTSGEIRFTDVTAAAGVDDPRWSTSATFADLDGNGTLDLYVANYVDFRLENHQACRSPGGRQDYCGPASYEGEPDRLFLNRGDGTFADVSGPAGLLGEPSSGLGVVAADFDRDGRSDLYVANDLRRNVLWHNLGVRDGVPRFENVALESGCAVSMLGRAQASMGVVAGDLDQDGDDDLFMTHLSADTNTVYINDGAGNFSDRSAASGLGTPSLENTGFGTVLFDFDNDGALDVFVANGAVKLIEEQARQGDPYPLKQANQLYRNRGDGTFVEISAEAGPELERLEVSRGVAAGDVDNDGRTDLLLLNNQGPARLLLVRGPGHHAWLGLRLRVRAGGRDALGARVSIHRGDGTVLWRRVATDGSYLSANDPRIVVGLGAKPQGSAIEVHWTDGSVETWTDLEAGRYHTLIAGQGKAGTATTNETAAPRAPTETGS